MLQTGLSLVLRVQYLKFTIKDDDHNAKEVTIEHRRGSESPRKGSQSPRKGSSASPRKHSGESSRSQPKSEFRLNYFHQQPSTIYMDMSDVEKQFKCNRSEIPHIFFARIRKLSSPKDQQQEKLNLSSGSGKQNNPRTTSKSSGESKEKISPHSEIPESPPICSEMEEQNAFACIVRVIVLDRRRQLCSDRYTGIVRRILEEQPLLKGHVIIPDMLRRFLKLDVTSRVWIQTIRGLVSPTTAFSLYPLGNVVGFLIFYFV